MTINPKRTERDTYNDNRQRDKDHMMRFVGIVLVIVFLCLMGAASKAPSVSTQGTTTTEEVRK